MADWRDRLDRHFREGGAPKPDEETSEIAQFIAGVVMPAFEELAPELEKHGRTVTIRNSLTSAAIIVQYEGEEEMTYRVQSRMFPTGMLPFADVRFRQRRGLRFISAESMFRSGAAPYRISDITREEIISNFLDNYTRRVMKG